MPSIPTRPGTLQFHKPNCQCPPCKRKAKTGTVGSGAEGQQPEAPASAPKPPPAEILVVGGKPVLTNDTKLESRILQVVALKAQGLKHKAIAEKLGVSESRISQIIWQANKRNLIEYDDPYERFQNQLVPKVVDNIEHWLNEKDKKMTIEAAKGAGIFKNHQALKVEQQNTQNIIALRIEMPPAIAGESTQMAVGTVVGKPRRMLEGTIVGDKDERLDGE